MSGLVLQPYSISPCKKGPHIVLELAGQYAQCLFSVTIPELSHPGSRRPNELLPEEASLPGDQVHPLEVSCEAWHLSTSPLPQTELLAVAYQTL